MPEAQTRSGARSAAKAPASFGLGQWAASCFILRILKDGSHSEEVFLPPQDLLHVLKVFALLPLP